MDAAWTSEIPSRTRRAKSAIGQPAAAAVSITAAGTSTPITEFVQAMATELGLDSSPSARRTERQLRRLVNWATGEGLPLEREIILDPDTVERFIEVELAGDRSRATYRAVLRRVGPRLTSRAPWETRAAAVARRQVAPPYTTDELAVLRSDALDQPTPVRRRAASAFLALGLGAGLDGRWAPRVAARDISRFASGVRVRVGDPVARGVVVLAEWENEVQELAATAGDEFLVGGYSTSARRTGHLTAELIVPTGHPRLAPARLRSTWLVTHLRAGTRMPELRQAAGLSGVTVLSDLLDWVDLVGDDVAAVMLRGRSQ